jgi:hypothetical protein
MGERLIRVVAAGWGLLLGTAAGGFVGANFAGLIAGTISFFTAGDRAPDLRPVQLWMHCGWVVGAALFLAAGIAHYAKKTRRGPEGNDGRPGSDGKALSVRRSGRPREREANSGRFRVTIDGRPCGILGSVGVGSFMGAFLGLMLGGSLLLLWFSFTYSPFAPRDWVDSVSSRKQRVGDGPRERRVATTQHPIALYLFFAPIAVGGAAGGLLSGAGTAFEKLRGDAADESSA